MRAALLGSCGILMITLFGVTLLNQPTLGQEKAAKAGKAEVRRPAPTDKGVSWSPEELNAVAQELAKSKETTHQFFAEKGYNMEVRRLVGPQPILLHGKKSDFMVIREGEGTFMSGGELVNGQKGGADEGDMRGDSIRGGVSRVLKPGDVMFVPAGIPHGFVNTKDHVTFVMVRFDTK